jgi:small-conductance mechanosensitive channel
LATGFAFAVRDVLLSFFAWIILLRKKPFRIGDYIRIGDDEGRVQHIGTFFVLLDSTPEFPDDFTRVPNKLFLEKSIVNFGKNIAQEKIRFQLNEIPDNKKQLFEMLERELSKKMQDNSHLFINIDLKDEKLYLLVEYHVNFKEKRTMKSEVIEIIYSIFKKHIFFPKVQ